MYMYEIMSLTHPQTQILLVLEQNKRETKIKTKQEVNQTTFVGNSIALSVCNKPLNLQASLVGGVVSPEGLTDTIPTNVFLTLQNKMVRKTTLKSTNENERKFQSYLQHHRVAKIGHQSVCTSGSYSSKAHSFKASTLKP